VRWLSHQLGNECQLAEQIPGPWQLFQTLQFGCSLLETRCGERIARGSALCPAALSKVPGIVSRHQNASCSDHAGISPAIHQRPNTTLVEQHCGVSNGQGK
jgi:hypothetical protein